MIWDKVPENFRRQFEKSGLPAVRVVASRPGNAEVVLQARKWVAEQEHQAAKEAAVEQRALTERSIKAEEDQAEAARDAARHARAASAAAWVAAVAAIIACILSLVRP